MFASSCKRSITLICRAALIKNSVHHGGDLELNSCFHRQQVKTLQRDDATMRRCVIQIDDLYLFCIYVTMIMKLCVTSK